MEVPKPVRKIRKKRHIGQSPIKKLKKECDRVWSLIVRLKNPTCIWCKRRAAVNAHHIISRRYLPTRYVIENGAALCGGCHMTAHQRPDRFIPHIKSVLGEKQYDLLCTMADFRKSRPDYALTLLALESLRTELFPKSYNMGGKG